MDQTQNGKEKYSQLVKQMSPNSHLVADCVKAFFVGGAICTLGQGINNFFISQSFSKDEASMYTSILLIFLGVFLTGLGVYGKIGKFAGSGSVVPITGFANSVAAPAIEFKKEGYVLGVGAKMFVVAGPVIVFGTLASVVVGIVYYIMK